MMKIISETLPNWFYKDVPKTFWHKEVESCFLKHPLFLGLATQIPEQNDNFVWNGFGRSFIVQRGHNGQIRIFKNSCRHRSSQIITQNNSPLKCPYHGWTYDSNGCLRSPKLKEDIKLCEYPSRLLFGNLIFLIPEGTSQSTLDKIESDIIFQNLDITNMKFINKIEQTYISARWPLIAENHVEAYHAELNHPLYMDLFEGGVFSDELYFFRTTDPLKARTPLVKEYLELMMNLKNKLNHLDPKMFQSWSFRYLYPPLNFSITPYEIAIDQLITHSPMESEIRSYRIGNDKNKIPEILRLREISDEIDKKIRDEDIYLFLQNQTGALQRDDSDPRGLLTDAEPFVVKFHTRLKKDLKELNQTCKPWTSI